MNNVKEIILIVSILLMANPLYSSQMWEFIPTDEFNGFVKESINFNDRQIIKVNKNKGYTLLSYDGNNIEKFSTNIIDEGLKLGISEMLNHNNRIYVTSASNEIFIYDESKNWDKLVFEDQYNSQDNKFRRQFSQITNSSNNINFLSSALDVKSIDTTQGGVIQIMGNAAYNEIFSFEGTELKKEYFINIEDLGRFYDITTDENGLWITSSKLLYLKDNKINDTIDIVKEFDFDDNIILGNILVDEDFVYILKNRTVQGTKNIDSYLITFNKKTRELKKIKFPDIDSYSNDYNKVNPSSFYNMEFYNDRIIIASNIGIYEYFNNEIKHIDVFGQFLSEIPSAFYPFLTTTDISISGDKFYISTNVGLIYTDVFTDVNNTELKQKLNIYPNIIDETIRDLTLESNIDMIAQSIELYDMSGKMVSKIKDVSRIKKGNNSLKVNYSTSGNYFLTIKTMNDSFIVPIIIIK